MEFMEFIKTIVELGCTAELIVVAGCMVGMAALVVYGAFTFVQEIKNS